MMSFAFIEQVKITATFQNIITWNVHVIMTNRRKISMNDIRTDFHNVQIAHEGGGGVKKVMKLHVGYWKE